MPTNDYYGKIEEVDGKFGKHDDQAYRPFATWKSVDLCAEVTDLKAQVEALTETCRQMHQLLFDMWMKDQGVTVTYGTHGTLYVPPKAVK